MLRLTRTFMCSTAAAFAAAAPGISAETAFARFQRLASAPAYRVRIETHDELGDRTEDAVFRYRHARDASELQVLEGRGAGARMTLVNGRLTVYGLPFVPGIGHRVAADDPGATSLRGNGVAAADLGAIAACFAAHASSIREVAGPVFDGRKTAEIVFDRRGATCPNDSNADRAIATDVLVVATDSGTPLLRKRFIGREIVEQWRFRNFAVDSAN